MEPALAISPSPAYLTRAFPSSPSSQNPSNATAAAAADAALLPIPNPAGTPFSIVMCTPVLISNSLRMACTTIPAVFLEGSRGTSPSADMVTIPSPLSRMVTLSWKASTARPKTSNPGPRLAVEAGAAACVSTSLPPPRPG